MPELAIKMDAVPGRINTVSTIITRPGVYFGSCYEICGVYHGYMPINIIAVPWDITTLIYLQDYELANSFKDFVATDYFAEFLFSKEAVQSHIDKTYDPRRVDVMLYSLYKFIMSKIK